MLVLFLLLSSFYLLVLIGVWIGLQRLKHPQVRREPRVSVVIAARNEARRIRTTLESLKKIEYPADKLEVILVDDHSTDETAVIIHEYTTQFSNWKYLQPSKQITGLSRKKNALLHGIQQASGEIIFTTDADCIVPPGWIREMVKHFHPDVSMVLGYSPLLRQKKWWYRILEFDNLFSAITAAAPTKIGYAFSSVGRNMAYRKSAYRQVGGYAALQGFKSGDDVHLTERFRSQKAGKIDFCAHPDTFVFTYPPENFREFWHQQIRKHSKTLKKTASSVVFSILLFLYFVLLFTIPFLNPHWILPWLAILAVRFVGEFICLQKAALIFRQIHLIKFFPLMQIFYPFYIIFFSILGAFQIYRWK